MSGADCKAEAIRSDAERRFLGRDHVVGVGIACMKPARLVFLLDAPEPGTEAAIREWATKSGASVEFKVVGTIRPLDRGYGGGREDP